MFYEMNKTKPSNFVFKLKAFEPLLQEPSQRQAKLVIYGVDEYFKTNWFTFTSEHYALPFQPVEFKGYKKVYLQYTRPLLTNSFELDLDIKTIEGNHNEFNIFCQGL